MNDQNQILCIGELLIDFICSDVDTSLVEGANFLKKAGGAPANVTAAIAKLGGKALFSGKVGKDPFGLFLKEKLDNVGVDTSMLILDEASNTTLAFVSLKADGERDFVFNRGADALLTTEEVDIKRVEASKILHFGSATALLGGPSKDTYLTIMEHAKKRGLFISFDPNYRVDLWKGRVKEFIELSKACLRHADFVKVSDEELKIISGEDNIDEGVKVFHQLGAQILAITLGKEGTLISNATEKVIVPSIKVESIDSTGAGDAFVGATLYQMAQLENPRIILRDFEKMKEIIGFSNKVGAIVCTKLGAIDSLPTIKDLESYK